MIPFLNFEEDFLTTEDLLFLAGASGVKGVEDTATGNPLTFQTDLARPLKSLLIPFTPQQEGTGDPSPQNIRPITGWDAVNVNHAGKNLFDISDLIGETGITVSGNEITGRMYRLFNLGTVDLVDSIPQGTTFKVALKAYTDGNYTTSGSGLNIQIVDTNGNSTTVVRINNNVLEETYFNISITAEAEIVGIKFGYNSGNENNWHIKGLVIGEADVYQASFPSTVYGGTLDVVSGVLTVEWGRYDLGQLSWELKSNGENHWFYSEDVPGLKIISDSGILSSIMCERYKTVRGAYIYNGSAGDNVVGQDGDVPRIRIRDDSYNNDADAFKTAMSGVYLYFELAAPTEQTLTGHQITAIVGDNTIWSDADGSMTAVYLKKG